MSYKLKAADNVALDCDGIPGSRRRFSNQNKVKYVATEINKLLLALLGHSFAQHSFTPIIIICFLECGGQCSHFIPASAPP